MEKKNEQVWYAISYVPMRIDETNVVFVPVNLITGEYDKECQSFFDDAGTTYTLIPNKNLNCMTGCEDRFFAFPITDLELQKEFAKEDEEVIASMETDPLPSDTEVFYAEQDIPAMTRYFERVGNFLLYSRDANPEIYGNLCQLYLWDKKAMDLVELRHHEVSFFKSTHTMKPLLDSLFEDFQPLEEVVDEAEIMPSSVSKSKEEASLKVPFSKEALLEHFVPNEVIKYITERVMFQDNVVRAIVNTIYRNIKYSDYPKLHGNILLAGPPGHGKTETFNLLSKILDIPIIIRDATMYSKTGYEGLDIKTILSDLVAAADGDIQKAQHGVVFIDEFDKLAETGEGSTISKKDVQDELLKILEGGECKLLKDSKNGSYDTGQTINTSGITFVLGGAYEELYKKKNIGFGASSTDAPMVSRKDGERYGIRAQVLRRCPVFLLLNPLTVEQMEEIARKSKISSLVVYNTMLKNEHQIKLVYPNELVSSLAREAIKIGGGVSGLDSAVATTFSQAMDEIDNSKASYSKLVLTENTAINPNDYTLVKRRKSNKKR